jgi:tRNA/tmRNA/rRNA uracil-C5-methylase (TrmA/RlmC/RlmD family)
VEELFAKLQRLNDSLQRIGGLAVRASEILSAGQTEGYRNKAVFHCDSNGGSATLGFYRHGSHEIIPINHCLLLKEEINEALRNGLNGLAEPSGDITLRAGRNGLYGPFEEALDGLVFRISGFFQVNVGAALLLYQKAREYAAMTKNETLVDLYCGVGSLTLFVGRDAGYALGVEQDSAAVDAARENACRNDLAHIEFICADVAKLDIGVAASQVARTMLSMDDGASQSQVVGVAPSVGAGPIAPYVAEITPSLNTVAPSRQICAAHPDCVIVDPPRKGMSPGAIRKILELSPNRIVYISCDPATLARDLRALSADYVAVEACAVDMFPRTANVETVVLLRLGCSAQ